MPSYHLTASLSCWLQELCLPSVKYMWYIAKGWGFGALSWLSSKPADCRCPQHSDGLSGRTALVPQCPWFPALVSERRGDEDQSLGDCGYAASPRLPLCLTFVLVTVALLLAKPTSLADFQPFIHPVLSQCHHPDICVWNTLLPGRTCLRKGVETV